MFKHFKKVEFDSKLIVFQWFVCLFSSYLEFELSQKVFDLFVLKGIKVIFSISLAIFEAMEKKLLKKKDFGEIYEYFSFTPKKIKGA